MLIIVLKVKWKGKSDEREQILLSAFDPFSNTLVSRKTNVFHSQINIELFSIAVKSQFHLWVSSEAKTSFQNKKILPFYSTMLFDFVPFSLSRTIIITLVKSQWIWPSSGFSHWRDYKSNWITSNQMLVFAERGKPDYARGKTYQNRVENKQTQSLYCTWWVVKLNLGHNDGRQELSPLHQPSAPVFKSTATPSIM